MTFHTIHRCALVLTALALTACGGGGGGDAAPAATPLSVRGSVATGAALVDARVQIQCATGSATTRTTADGSYAAAITGGALPCLLRATSSDGGMVLHSLVESLGPATSPIVANITPVTELVLARLLADADTTGAFDAFTAATRDQLTPAAVASAVAAIQSALAAIDPLFATMDPLRGSFTPAGASSSGDATDRAIDALVAHIDAAAPDANSAQERLRSLARILAQAPAAGAAAAAKAFLAPPVASCPALRNVAYRFIGTYGDVFKASNVDWSAGKAELRTNDGAPEAVTVSFDSAQPCRFVASARGFAADGYTATSGVIVLRDHGNAERSPGLGLGFPEQKLAVSDLAGTWNVVGFAYRRNYDAFRNSQFVVTFDAQGKITSALDCRGTTTLNDPCPSSLETDSANAFVANPDGGFLAVDGRGNVMPGNIYVFRDAAGNMVMLLTDKGGGLSIGNRQAAVPLPSAGTSVDYWNVGLGQPPGVARLGIGVSSSRYTFQSVDAAAGTVTRQRTLLNGAANGRMDIKHYNRPRAGVLFSEGSSYTLNGNPLGLEDALTMPIPGMGLSVEIHPGGAAVDSMDMFLSVSIVRPAQ